LRTTPLIRTLNTAGDTVLDVQSVHVHRRPHHKNIIWEAPPQWQTVKKTDFLHDYIHSMSLINQSINF